MIRWSLALIILNIGGLTGSLLLSACTKKKAWISLINMENQAYSGRGSVQAFLTTLILAFCAVGWESESKGSAIVLILEAANNFCLQHHCLAL